MTEKKSEIFDIVDENDQVIGQAPRSCCHGDPSLIHRVAHVLVFNPAGSLLLQKRARTKDIQPGKWDTSVGGHLDPGESYREAALREMKEELGITGIPLTYLYSSKIRNDIESENVATYLTCYDGELTFPLEEIEEVRFWSGAEIDAVLGRGQFTPNFEEEWTLFKDWWRRLPIASDRPVAFCAGDSFPDLLKDLINN
ncbi:NUDIX domain-containing protein [Desulfuromonas sp. AOP6]|uniref:NUDIX hydrolase n=1 Tax=Desulfuromonas sp. AOP6 TaxID=1566351 RepID=UPI0012884B3B|nr:NUDIX domain-containing protein [Desulfuromonas sp. AOP6]BCA79445.1 NUDIX hydrolase [Desulfuromonas sp. AOP6]